VIYDDAPAQIIDLHVSPETLLEHVLAFCFSEQLYRPVIPPEAMLL
jgi:hypothetical protein